MESVTILMALSWIIGIIGGWIGRGAYKEAKPEPYTPPRITHDQFASQYLDNYLRELRNNYYKPYREGDIIRAAPLAPTTLMGHQLVKPKLKSIKGGKATDGALNSSAKLL